MIVFESVKLLLKNMISLLAVCLALSISQVSLTIIY